MRYRWLIIDGNNLIHADAELVRLVRDGFNEARVALVRRLEPLVGLLAERITVIFDGGPATSRSSGYESARREPLDSAVEVFFSPPQFTADSVIERLVSDQKDRGVLVVSSDYAERHTVEAAGVDTISCRSFLELAAKEDRLLRKKITTAPKNKITLDNFFPPSS